MEAVLTRSKDLKSFQIDIAINENNLN